MNIAFTITAILKVLQWLKINKINKKEHFFSFKFWNCDCLLLDWQDFELWFLSRGCLLWVKFWIPRSAITYVPNWPIGSQNFGSKVKWRHWLTTLKFQRVNAAYYIMQNKSLKVWKPDTPVLHNNSAAYTIINYTLKLSSLWRHFLLDPALSKF